MMENWKKRPNGDVEVGPLMGWSIGVIPMTGLVRLEAAMSEEALQSGERAVLQVAMTETQLRELAQSLLRTADALAAQPKGPKQ
jgi:hypothetical protein